MSKKDRMAQAEISVPARYYRQLVELLQAENIPPEQLLANCGLESATLADADATLSIAQIEALTEATLALRPQPGVGLDLGKSLKLTSHSFVGFGILSSPNLDYALRLTARYFGLIMPSFRMRYRPGPAQLRVEFIPQAHMSQSCLDLHLEVISAAAHCEIRELLQGGMPAYELHLSLDRPSHHARYADIFREARCHFASLPAPGISMRFPASIAGRPLALADSTALKAAEARCQALVKKVLGKGRISDWVGMMLRESGDGMPTLDELARTLNMSTRTLDRHLQKEGAGFRELRNSAQHSKARELLADPLLPITQIAHELGYTDAANFSRAFRRETGLSPRTYRQQQR